VQVARIGAHSEVQQHRSARSSKGLSWLARAFNCTPMGLNPEPFEIPGSETGAIPLSHHP